MTISIFYVGHPNTSHFNMMNANALNDHALILGDLMARDAYADHGGCADIGVVDNLVRSSAIESMLLACPEKEDLEIVILVDTSGSFGANRVQDVGDFIKTLAVRFDTSKTFLQI